MPRRIRYQTRALRTAARPRPFPWATLDSMTHAEVRLLREGRRRVESFVRVGRLDEALARVLGTRVALRVRRAGAAARAVDAAVVVRLAFADDATDERCLVIEAEPALVAAVTARALRRSAPHVVKASVANAEIAGAFAAVLASVGRHAAGERGLRVASVASVASVGIAAPSSEAGAPDRVAFSVTIMIDDDAYAARIVCPAIASPEVPWTRQALALLGATPLDVPVVACAWRTTAADVASLRPGDILVSSPRPGCRPQGGEWLGQAWLAGPASDMGVRIDLGDGRAIVLGGGPDLLDGAPMAESDATETLVTAIGDIPVVVRVEIGEATLPAREWAALAKGDVIALGRRVGDRVLLRVGGVPVARGELVEVEGEVGVRIVERIGAETEERTP